MTDKLICPNCKNPLLHAGNCLTCENGHSFDIAKEGYTNLVLPSQKGSKSPGDNAEMVAARREFLELGYFLPLAQQISKIAEPLLLREEKSLIVDAGCGEGYYDFILHDYLSSPSISYEIIGMDISKAAISKAAKAGRACNAASNFVVGSAYAMPVASESADIILNIFAPHCPEEFSRILSLGGHALVAVPAARHLWELKEFLYDIPYENPPASLDFAGFELCHVHEITYKMALDNRGLRALFEMTPYAYKTPQDAKVRLIECSDMRVTASFEVYDFKKK